MFERPLCVALDGFTLHAARYAGVLGSASKLRSRLPPKRASASSAPWAELLRRTFGFDVLACPRCEGRMRLLAMVTEPKSVARYLRALGEPTEAPARGPT